MLKPEFFVTKNVLCIEFNKDLTDAASFLFLFVRIIFRLEGQLSLLLQFENFLKQLIDIDVILGRSLEVLYFPHFLKYSFSPLCVMYVHYSAHLERLPCLGGDLALARLLVTLVAHQQHGPALQTPLHLVDQLQHGLQLLQTLTRGY